MVKARQNPGKSIANGSGYWPTDKSILGVTVTRHADLATIDPIWPKLWRRLDEYLRDHPSLGRFHEFLEEKNERVDLLTIMEERGLHDFIEVDGNQVRLIELPENLRVVSAAGQRSH